MTKQQDNNQTKQAPIFQYLHTNGATTPCSCNSLREATASAEDILSEVAEMRNMDGKPAKASQITILQDDKPAATVRRTEDGEIIIINFNNNL